MSCTPTRTCITTSIGNFNYKKQFQANFSPEQGVTHGAPWTDKKADLYIKRHFSIGNQKMMLENKVDRFVNR